MTEQYRRQAQIDGQWTVSGLARHLGVTYDWLYRQITRGRVKVERHPLTKQYLIADDPAQIAALRAKVSSEQLRVLHVEPPAEGGASDAAEPEPAHD